MSLVIVADIEVEVDRKNFNQIFFAKTRKKLGNDDVMKLRNILY